MDIIKFDVYRGPNLGVYISVNNKFGLVPMGFAETKSDKLAEYLNIEILHTAVANTRLIGALCVMNNNGILLPTTAYQNEFDYLKEVTDLEVGVLDTKFNALGNVICANDKGAAVSPLLSKEDCKTVSDVLGVEVIQKKIAGSNLSGVAISANNSGAAIHPGANEGEIKTISDVLGVNVEPSSINNGVPYVSSGILANDHCLVVGSMTSGPEIMNLTRAFLN
jgi:translation initiation factor 6